MRQQGCDALEVTRWFDMAVARGRSQSLQCFRLRFWIETAVQRLIEQPLQKRRSAGSTDQIYPWAAAVGGNITLLQNLFEHFCGDSRFNGFETKLELFLPALCFPCAVLDRCDPWPGQIVDA